MQLAEWLGEDNQLGQDIWHQKYQYDDETFEEWLSRISNNDTELMQQIREKRFLFGGRILANRGLAHEGRKITYSNCYVVSPPQDSIESIFETATKLARTYSYGGGCGVDISKLSPKGAKIHNAAKETSGAVSFMDLYSLVTELIGQNGRRGALMISIDCSHPDVEDFIKIKTDLNKVTKANISIRISDDFMDAVEQGKKWKLHFKREETGEVIERKVDAKSLFRLIAETNWDYAEPGALFWDRIKNWNLLANTKEFEFAGTNPCITGDTLIFTGDGRYVVPIERLYREYCYDSDNFNVPVLTWNSKLQRTKFEKINWVQYSGIKPVYTVTLDDGSTIRATSDHKFMLSDGTKVPLSQLHAGDCLMPFYSKCYEEYTGFRNLYVNLNNGKTKNYYHLQSEYYFGVNLDSFGRNKNSLNVHHIDENHMNNAPNNLSILTTSNHSSNHIKGENNPMVRWFNETTEERRQAYRDKMRARNTGAGNPNYGKKASKATLHRLSAATSEFMKRPEVKQKHRAGNMRHRASMIKQVLLLLQSNNLPFTKENYNRYKSKVSKVCPSYDTIINTAEFFDIPDVDTFFNYLLTDFNHRIVSIEYTGEEPVYDMNVFNNHNFAVATKCTLPDEYTDFDGTLSSISKLSGIIIGNCAEEPLPAGGSCILGSINLSEFVENPFTIVSDFDFDSFKNTVKIAVKALNDVLDEGLPLHPLQEQRDSVRDWRQIGLGIMGLADCLLKMGLKYGSKESLDFCDNVGQAMIQTAIETSSDFAREKGSYPKFNAEDVISTMFFECNGSKYLEHRLKNDGLRNSQLLTIAPTGTLSTMLGISGGVEPIYANYYTRKTESLYGEPVYYKVYTPIVKQYMELNNITDDKDLPDYFVTAMDLDYHQRINMQSTWQRRIDASISSTVNVPHEFTVEDTEELYDYAWRSCVKGITIFRDGCARLGVLSTSNPAESSELKRGEVIHVSDNLIGKKRKLITGCGSLHCIALFDRESGELRETYLSKGSTGGCNNFMIGLSRMISIAARGGISIQDIVDQLNSTGVCPSYAVRRATQKDTSKGSCCPVAVGNALLDMYNEMQAELKSGSISEEMSVDDEELIHDNLCPECGEELVFEEGCNICKNCGWSKCS